jgi:hypothetical protein
MTTNAVPDAYRSRACGIDVAVGFPCAALPSDPTADAEQPSVLTLATGALDVPGWCDRRVEQHYADGSLALTFDSHGEHGHVLWADRFGRFHVDAEGLRIRCLPDGSPADWWQRLLIAQVIPLAAVLRGLELLHASAVRIDDSAFAIVGGSGAGKSVIALNCVAEGGDLLSDDALAISGGPAGIVAHAGPPVANVLAADVALVRRLTDEGIATIVGQSDKTHLLMNRRCREAPLTAIYFLARAGSDQPGVERIVTPTPGLILGATFNFYLRTPARLRRQLEILARASRELPLFRVDAPEGVRPAAVAEMLQAHFRSLGAVRT